MPDGETMSEPTTHEIVLSLRQTTTYEVISGSVAVRQYVKDAAARLGQQSNEIDQLRKWKAEAILVIEAWEECYSALESHRLQAPLGTFKSAFVKGWIEEQLLRRPWSEEDCNNRLREIASET